MNTADRKKQLLAQGALYRTEAILAKQSVSASLQPATLTRNALPGFALAALSALRGSGSAGASRAALPAVLPLLFSLATRLAKGRAVPKSLLRGLMAGSLVAGAAALIMRKKASSGSADSFE